MLSTKIHIDGDVYHCLNKKSIEKLCNLITVATPIFSKVLALDIVCPIRITHTLKKFKTLGHYINQDNLIEIDANLGTLRFVEVLAHELTHYRQYYYKRLALNVDKSNNEVFYLWDNQKFLLAKTYMEYLNYPWEREARKSQYILTRIFKNFLKKTKLPTIDLYEYTDSKQ